MKRDRRGRFLPVTLAARIGAEPPPAETGRPDSVSRTRRGRAAAAREEKTAPEPKRWASPAAEAAAAAAVPGEQIPRTPPAEGRRAPLERRWWRAGPGTGEPPEGPARPPLRVCQGGGRQKGAFLGQPASPAPSRAGVGRSEGDPELGGRRSWRGQSRAPPRSLPAAWFGADSARQAQMRWAGRRAERLELRAFRGFGRLYVAGMPAGSPSRFWTRDSPGKCPRPPLPPPSSVRPRSRSCSERASLSDPSPEMQRNRPDSAPEAEGAILYQGELRFLLLDFGKTSSCLGCQSKWLGNCTS